MDLTLLRTSTRSDHDATEALLPLTSPTLTRPGYVAALRGMAAILFAWDRWAEAHVPDAARHLLAGRQRGALIARDLQFFGVDPDTVTPVPVTVELPADDTALPTFLGAMYVVEGSTLGGQYIARHVEEVFGLTPGEGDAYFRGYGDHTGEQWNSFKQQLAALPEADTTAVISGAKSCFAFFRVALEGGSYDG